MKNSRSWGGGAVLVGTIIRIDDIENKVINYQWKDDGLIKEVKNYYSDLKDKNIYYYTGDEYIKLDK